MRRSLRRFGGILLLVLAAAVVATALGSANIRLGDVLGIMASRLPGVGALVKPTWSTAHEMIVLRVRLPRVFLALVVGGGLSVAGVLFQGSLRNPLADPYIIGVSSGASLGAAVGLLVIIPRGLVGLGFLPLFAFAGAILATLAVARLGQRRGRLEPTSLLLAGVAMGAFLTAVVSLLMVLRIENLQDVYLWLMGSLSGRTWDHLLMALPYVGAGLLVALWLAKDLNVYLLGEEAAHSLGIDVQKVQRLVLISGSLMAAACVSVSGVIGFVGLMVPHALRLLVGAEHRRLILHSLWAGALFLLVADTLARTAFSPLEIPVGIITAFVGGPFFIYLLKRGSSFHG
ncbi:MAG: FecCD family ABC transporter permease [Limnochordia bacterium]|nr:iron ABC transporter permease [Bacillota bacterium]NLL08902.1 iron ABC transporter permease [Bacillota bacterium]HBG09710.1 iron ABC transporter [Bacillota bacterium]